MLREQLGVRSGELAQARGGERGAGAGYAGSERGGLRDPEREPVRRARVAARAALGATIGEEHRDRPGEQAGGDRAAAREAPGYEGLEQEAGERGRRERGGDQERVGGVRVRDGAEQLTARLERERGAGAGVEGDLERLAKARVELGVGPARE